MAVFSVQINMDKPGFLRLWHQWLNERCYMKSDNKEQERLFILWDFRISDNQEFMFSGSLVMPPDEMVGWVVARPSEGPRDLLSVTISAPNGVGDLWFPDCVAWLNSLPNQ